MRRGLAALVVAVTVLVTAAAGAVTQRLYASSPLDRDDAAVVADALPRLAFLRNALDSGAAERAQQLFPEGYFFSHVLYGLTWVDVGMRDDGHRERALEQARWALDQLDSTAGRAPFSERLDPPYGVFYTGWTSWLRGGVVRLAGGPEAAPVAAERLSAEADALAAAFTASLDTSGSPFLPAYPGQAWPVDSAVGVAALALADHLRGTDAYGELVERWLDAAEQRRDPATGLLPHRVDATTGEPATGARGSSQALALRFLRELDPATAARDWVRFRDQFGSPVPGLPGIREHPRGTDLPGDVDSGPLILGMSASASAVALGSAALFGDRATASALTGLAEATGMPVQLGGERRYLAGRLPVGDAFLAWSMTADGWLVPAGATEPPGGGPSGWWRLPWHLVTLLLVAPGWLLTVVAIRASSAGPTARQPQ